MWVNILFCEIVVLQLKFNVLVGNLHADLGEDSGTWTHGNFTSTRKFVWRMLLFTTLLHMLLGYEVPNRTI